MSEEKKPLRRDATKFPGWMGIIKSLKRKINWNRYVEEFYESPSGVLFVTLKFEDKRYETYSYTMADGSERKGKRLVHSGTPLWVKRRCWHATIKAMLQSETVCAQCGKKRVSRAKCCPKPRNLENLRLTIN